MDDPLARLALLLDPRYRTVLANNYQPLLKPVSMSLCYLLYILMQHRSSCSSELKSICCRHNMRSSMPHDGGVGHVGSGPDAEARLQC
jgi:hypothetical protein